LYCNRSVGHDISQFLGCSLCGKLLLFLRGKRLVLFTAKAHYLVSKENECIFGKLALLVGFSRFTRGNNLAPSKKGAIFIAPFFGKTVEGFRFFYTFYFFRSAIAACAAAKRAVGTRKGEQLT